MKPTTLSADLEEEKQLLPNKRMLKIDISAANQIPDAHIFKSPTSPSSRVTTSTPRPTFSSFGKEETMMAASP